MENIKVVAWDVYGTILPSKGEQVKRRGLDSVLEKLEQKGLILCTCSDAKTESIFEDFKEAELNPEYFDKFFKMKRVGKDFYNQPKNFSLILKHYRLHPKELLVIGDREGKDIRPAKELGCEAILVPEYITAGENGFDLNKLFKNEFNSY